MISASVRPRSASVVTRPARSLSVGQDRTTGDALLHFVDTLGRFVELRIPAGQVDRLAIGAAGLASARGKPARDYP